MAFQNRSQFINAASSEKITLAQVDAKARLYVFSGPVLNIYSKQVPYFVQALKQDNTDLTKVENLASVVEGTFYYDIKESTLYARLIGDVAPNSVELIATYRLFFSEKGLSLPYDLADISEDVFWDGRIVSSPGYKHKIGIDQALTSLVGEGTLHLKNQDGGLDGVFDTLIFENQDVAIYSWNPDLQPSEARVIYRGKVTNKTFDGTDVKFKIKDQIFNLLDSPSLSQYTAADNVGDSVQGQLKRRVYGRVDGLRCQSTDQIAAGVTLTGAVSMAANSLLLSGTGTAFLSEVTQGDTIIVGTQEFEVEEVLDDTSITTSDEAEYAFSGQTATLTPQRGTSLKNRSYLATGHICAEVTHTILSVPQFNRFTVDSTDGLFPGDFVEFVDTGERLEIKNIAPGNLVVLVQNMVQKPANGTLVKRQPIQEVYIGSRRVSADDFTINNTASGCGLTFDTDVEFNLARAKNTVFSGTFTNGTRNVAIATTEVSPSEVISPGDWIKPNGITYTTFYKVVNVKDDEINLASAFSDPTTTDTIELKSPDYLEDNSVVSVNILGRTVDGTASGTWISNAAQVQRDLIEDVGIVTYNTASFTEGEADSPQLISLAIPEDFTTKTPPKVKDIVDKVSKSVNSSLTLDNDLLIKFKTLNVFTGEDLPVIRDSDVIDWKVRSTNGKTFRRVFARYRFTDVDLTTLESGNKAIDYTSEFVERYIGTNKVDELDLYLYEGRDALIATHRHSYYNQLGVATVTITTDLRLEDIEIGEPVILDLRRMYRRFGDQSVRKKVMLVIGKTLTGSRTELILSDLGNTFNTSSYITPNDAPDWTAATEDQKLIYGYITDNQGIVNNEEDTAGTHLIS